MQNMRRQTRRFFLWLRNFYFPTIRKPKGFLWLRNFYFPTIRKPKGFLCFAVGIFIFYSVFSFYSVHAASLSNARDLITTSNLAIAADHELAFTTSFDVGANGYFEVTFPTGFGDLSTGACSGPNVTLSHTLTTLRCTYSVAPGATSTVISITNVTNPVSAGSKLISIITYNSSDVEQESVDLPLFFIEKTNMAASVLSNISFDMDTATTVSEVNGIPITGSSTPTTLPFNNLDPSGSSTLAHTLVVESNAENGFSCTVQQDGDLTNESGETINSFHDAQDGTGSSTDPIPWESPAAIPGQDNTYGHYGITTDDDSLSALDFTGGKYAGLNGTDPLEIMYHSGPADGKTLGIGVAHIAYTIEISPLQEPGDYTNSLTYICTGNY